MIDQKVLEDDEASLHELSDQHSSFVEELSDHEFDAKIEEEHDLVYSETIE